MQRKLGICLAEIATALLLGGGIAAACGDKFVILGRGMRTEMGRARNPASILVFNNPDNPLEFLYGTLLILALCNVYHYHAQGFLIATTSINQISRVFDEASTSLGGGFLKTLWDVILPIISPSMPTRRSRTIACGITPARWRRSASRVPKRKDGSRRW